MRRRSDISSLAALRSSRTAGRPQDLLDLESLRALGKGKLDE